MGGVWQAMLFGFAGVSIHNGQLHIEPRLPKRWRRLGMRFRCLGRQVALTITTDDIRVDADGPLRVHAAGRSRLVAGPTRFPRVAEPLPAGEHG